MTKPKSNIKTFQKFLSCLPSFANKLHDDHKFGTTHYLENTLDILLHEMPSSNPTDISMAVIETKKIGEKLHRYKCPELGTVITLKDRSFSISCSYLVPYSNVAHITRCLRCNINDTRAHIGSPCLACHFANVVFCNPFGK